MIFKQFLYAVLLTAVLPCLYGASTTKEEPRDLAIEMGAPFHDSAILQRNMNVPVWGWAEPGAKITVSFASQKKSTKAAANGKWMLTLDELKANDKPSEMIIETAGKKEVLKDILVGEVWVASGQSNMQWNASKCDVGRVLIKQMQERVKAGKEKEPVIREALVTNYFAALHPVEHAKVKWSPGGSASSAIAYAFAYELYTELKVPIGILNCSFSQTAIQAWTPKEGFAAGKDDYTKAIYKKVLESDPSTSEHKKAWNEFYSNIENTLKENEGRIAAGKTAKAFSTKTPGNLSSNRDATWLFNARFNPMIPYAIRGAIWNQGYANMGEGLVYYNNLHSMIRGWRLKWNRPNLPVYFHQFYSPGHKGGRRYEPVIGKAADMRLGTWLARDIPNTGMASQIDMTGGIHYGSKALPGKRLALHALKKQYGRDVITDGPMFKSYTVSGDKLIVELEHADGLLVAETGTDAKKGIANPTVIPNGEAAVKFFYIADEKKVWHPATVRIEGNKLILNSAGVKTPCGVSYGSGGIGNQPAIFNGALLPLTPFTYYENKMVSAASWPEEKLKIANQVVNPNSVGKLAEWRSMPLLSTQFRDNAVLQAGQPITFWGSALHDYGYEATGKAVIKLTFAGVEKTIDLYDESVIELGAGESRGESWKEWRMTLPAMEASADPKTLKVTFLIDGEIAHERICKNIVIGDVWFVAAPSFSYRQKVKTKSSSIVRMLTSKAKRFKFRNPSRYSICVSRLPGNRFASVWSDASGFAADLGNMIGAKTGNPVGIVYMQTALEGKPAADTTELKSWIKADSLKSAPSLMGDYKDLAVVRPGNEYYNANAREYVKAWKKHWGEYIPQLIKSKKVPDSVPWGSYPQLTSTVSSTASQVYNVMVHSLTPGSFKGVVFLTGESLFRNDDGGNFASEFTALANSWKNSFGGDPEFFYTIPSKTLAAKISKPAEIKGKSSAFQISEWFTSRDAKAGEVSEFIDSIVQKTYK